MIGTKSVVFICSIFKKHSIVGSVQESKIKIACERNT